MLFVHCCRRYFLCSWEFVSAVCLSIVAKDILCVILDSSCIVLCLFIVVEGILCVVGACLHCIYFPIVTEDSMCSLSTYLHRVVFVHCC